MGINEKWITGYPAKDGYPPPSYPAQGYPTLHQGYAPHYHHPPPPPPQQSAGLLEGWYAYSLSFFVSYIKLSI